MSPTETVPATALRLAALATDPARRGRSAIVSTGRELTYGDLDDQADLVASALRREGTGAGDRVAFVGDDAASFITFMIGAARIGAVSVPLNWRLAPSELVAILRDSEAVVLVTSGAAFGALTTAAPPPPPAPPDPGAPDDRADPAAPAQPAATAAPSAPEPTPPVLGAVRRFVVLPQQIGTGERDSPALATQGAGPTLDRVRTWSDWLHPDSPDPATPAPASVDNPHAAPVGEPRAATVGRPEVAYSGSPDDVVLQMYTSGTTGRPKGVMLTDTNLSASIPELGGLWLLDHTSRMLGVLPLFHIAGLGAAIGTLWSGATLVVADDPSAVTLLRTIETERITNVVLASVILQRLLVEAGARAESSPADLSSLRIVGYGAAPISQATLHEALRLLPCGLLQVYGLTECAGTISVLRPEDHDAGDAGAERLRSCGRPLASLELRLRDPHDGREVELGEVGEILIRSPRVTPGYWGLPEATAEAIMADGWLRTGDLAYQDANGYLYLCDRLRDMIVSGGENVYPAEVEDVLQWHPAVAEVAVVGVPDDRWGEIPRAVVVLAEGADAGAEELVDFARARLAHFKCPKSVDFADALPRNATGKVLRRTLREPYWAGRSRLVN